MPRHSRRSVSPLMRKWHGKTTDGLNKHKRYAAVAAIGPRRRGNNSGEHMNIQIIENIVLIFHVLAALAIIGLVLMQQGRGADMGSGFGGGSSNTVFGSSGAGNFLTRTTTTIAIVFFVTSFTLAYFAKERSASVSELGIPQQGLIEAVEVSPEELELPDLPIPEAAEEGEVPKLPE